MMKKGSKSGGITDEDALLWQTVTKSVKAYGAKKAAKAAVAKTTPKISPKISAKPVMPKTRLEPPVRNVPPAPVAVARGFDKSTSTKFKRGRLPIEGTLDLHGMTQDKAMTALQGFIKRAWRDGKRTLLIITGKGDRGRSTGVLRRMLPMWLEDGEFGTAVLAISPAQPRDGGDGAFYVRLRKSR